jgi:stearoyl-CoA desaturase (delta-9 desaturase)
MKRFQELTFSRLYGFFWIVLGHVALGYLIVTLQWQLLLVALGMHYLISIVGISMTYHRSISHNAVQLPRWLEFIGLFVAGLSLQGSALSWTAAHRQHHRYQGTDKDPHSPKLMSAWYVQIFGYGFSKIDPRSVANLFKTHHAVWHRYYYWIYVPILLGSLLALPPDLALALFWAPIAIVFHFEGFINTWTHNWNQDVPGNKPWVNLFVGGEAWHENHHTHPGNLRFHKYDVLGLILERYFKKDKVNAVSST